MQDIYQGVHLSSANAATTVTIMAGTQPCVLCYVTVNATSAQALTFADGKNNQIAVLKASVAEGAYHYFVCVNGLQVTVPTGYTGDATVAWDPL